MMVLDVFGVEDSCCQVLRVAPMSYVRARTVSNSGALSDKKDQKPIHIQHKKIQNILEGRQLDIFILCDDYLGTCNICCQLMAKDSKQYPETPESVVVFATALRSPWRSLAMSCAPCSAAFQ